MAAVIMLTRLNGEQFAVNPDLLERVEATPDTVLTLLDGTKYVVLEPVAAVIREIRDFRASVIAAARQWEQEPTLSVAPRPVESADTADDDQPIAPAVPINSLRRP